MIRIAVLGDIDSIKGFGAVGLDVFPCTDQQSAHDSFKKITGSGNYGVLFITEEFAALLRKEISAFDGEFSPAIIPIPGAGGTSGYARAAMKANMEKAVGADILMNQ